jgi:hypothetical protein
LRKGSMLPIFFIPMKLQLFAGNYENFEVLAAAMLMRVVEDAAIHYKDIVPILATGLLRWCLRYLKTSGRVSRWNPENSKGGTLKNSLLHTGENYLSDKLSTSFPPETNPIWKTWRNVSIKKIQWPAMV